MDLGAASEAKRPMARVTGLEPATSGVTGRTVFLSFQRPFRKPPTLQGHAALAAPFVFSECARPLSGQP